MCGSGSCNVSETRLEWIVEEGCYDGLFDFLHGAEAQVKGKAPLY